MAAGSPVPMTPGTMAGPIYTDRVICGMRGFEMLHPGGSTFGMMFGFRDYPEIARPDILDGLLKCQAPAGDDEQLSLPLARRGIDRMALKQRRMTNAGDRAVSLHEGLDEAMDDVQSGRSVMGDHHWSLAVHADSIGDLRRRRARSRASWPTPAHGRTGGAWLLSGLLVTGARSAGGDQGTARRHQADELLQLLVAVRFSPGRQAAALGPPDDPARDAAATPATTISRTARRVGHTLLIGPTGYGKTTADRPVRRAAGAEPRSPRTACRSSSTRMAPTN